LTDSINSLTRRKELKMVDTVSQHLPPTYEAIVEATKRSEFSMASDVKTCSLLRTLSASKPGGKMLELGTGTGLATAWILDGMDSTSTLISVDNDSGVLDIARAHLNNDPRLTLELSDGADWINKNKSASFDFIFADTWHGKYLLLEEILSMLRVGGIYIIDDMLPQTNWPDGHDLKAQALLDVLDNRGDLILTRQSWASGVVIGVRTR
jgi:predicted O-methyltransferase YrrM